LGSGAKAGRGLPPWEEEEEAEVPIRRKLAGRHGFKLAGGHGL
jgi:hypothetical protein